MRAACDDNHPLRLCKPHLLSLPPCAPCRAARGGWARSAAQPTGVPTRSRCKGGACCPRVNHTGSTTPGQFHYRPNCNAVRNACHPLSCQPVSDGDRVPGLARTACGTSENQLPLPSQRDAKGPLYWIPGLLSAATRPVPPFGPSTTSMYAVRGAGLLCRLWTGWHDPCESTL